MPLFELLCDQCGDVVELIRHYEDPDPLCETCGGQRKKAISTFGIVGTGIMTARYNDRKLEGAHNEGHWALDHNPKTGKRDIPVYIETFQQQREYCKRNNLYNPGEIGQMECHQDGKSFSSRGLPGAW